MDFFIVKLLNCCYTEHKVYPMKICLINNLYPPYSVGGAERVVERIAKEAVKNGDQAVVITWRPWVGLKSWQPIRTVEDGVVIYRFWVPNIFSYKNLAKHNFVLKLIWHKIDIFNCFSARIIKKILEQKKPDEVQTHNLMGIGFGAPRVIQKLGIKHTHYLHDVQLVEPSGVLPWNHERDSLWQKIYSLVIKSRFGRPDAIISPSKFLVEFYQKRGFFCGSQWLTTPSRLERDTPPSKGGDNLVSPYEGEMPRHTPGQRGRGFLFVGSLVDHKGIRVLMKAWDMVDKNARVELHIVGDGELKKEVEEWARGTNSPPDPSLEKRGDDRVKVYGRLNEKELEEVYKKSDVLIFPSICIENHPTVIDEAHRFGLRVIASDTGGVKEMMGEGDVLVVPGETHPLTPLLGREGD